MSSPPAYSPSALAAVALSTFAVRVAYRRCAPKNAMVSLHPVDPSSSSSEEHGACLEARVDDDNSEVALIVSARDADIARYCAKIAEELHGSLVSCTRITNDEQRQAALRPASADSDSDSDGEFESSSHAGPDLDRRALAFFRTSALSEFSALLGIFVAFFAAAGALAHLAR